MRFSDVVGQDAVKSYLRNSYRDGRLPHALLFSGSEGSGPLPMALALAQYMACESPGEADSCGECAMCRRMERFVHADLRLYVPLPGADADRGSDGLEDYVMSRFQQLLRERVYFTELEWYQYLDPESRKQGVISVSAVESLIESVWYRSYELPFKIVLIWLPERLHVSAANRLLKVVEEPPTETYYFFVTASEGSVLQTIRSRTQRIYLPPIDGVAIASYISRNSDKGPEESHRYAMAASGSMTDALALLESNEAPPFLQLQIELYRWALGNRYDEALGWVKKVTSLSRELQKALLRYFSRMLREIYMLNLGMPEACHLMGEELHFAQKASPYVNGRNVGFLLDEYSRTLRDISRNGNASIVFTDFALKHILRMGISIG